MSAAPRSLPAPSGKETGEALTGAAGVKGGVNPGTFNLLLPGQSGGLRTEGGGGGTTEGKGIFSQSLELFTGLEEASGFGAASNVGAKVAGREPPGQSVGKQVAGAEAKGEAGVKAAAGAVGGIAGWVGELLTGIETLLKDYAPRLLEVLAGGALVIFGLMTLVKGKPPSLPKAVPVPV